jgi:hypothetical protein
MCDRNHTPSQIPIVLSRYIKRPWKEQHLILDFSLEVKKVAQNAKAIGHTVGVQILQILNQQTCC